MHLVITPITNALLRQEGKAQKSKEWTYPSMSLVYRGFNAPSVPRDMGGREFDVSPVKFWAKLKNALSYWLDVQHFLNIFPFNARKDMCRHNVLAAFGLSSPSKGTPHPRPFLHTIEKKESLASVVLGRSTESRIHLPEAPILEILISLFRPHALSEDLIHKWRQNSAVRQPIRGERSFLRIRRMRRQILHAQSLFRVYLHARS